MARVYSILLVVTFNKLCKIFKTNEMTDFSNYMLNASVWKTMKIKTL